MITGFDLLYLLCFTMLLAGGGDWGQSGPFWGMMESLGLCVRGGFWALFFYLSLSKTLSERPTHSVNTKRILWLVSSSPMC